MELDSAYNSGPVWSTRAADMPEGDTCTVHGMQESADVELWDPEDADDCDDEDELFSSAAMSDSDPAGQDGSMQKSIAGSAATWDQVRPCHPM